MSLTFKEIKEECIERKTVFSDRDRLESPRTFLGFSLFGELITEECGVVVTWKEEEVSDWFIIEDPVKLYAYYHNIEPKKIIFRRGECDDVLGLNRVPEYDIEYK